MKKMRVLCFGSLNYDHVYDVDHFVKPEETLKSRGYKLNYGGKGLNQSIACHKAGLDVYHAGAIGNDGEALRSYLSKHNINCDYILNKEEPTGHAIIQVANGQNNIIIYQGANACIDHSDIKEVLSHFWANDLLLIQNEVSHLSELIHEAHARHMRIVLNLAPMDQSAKEYPLEKVDTLIVNEIEAMELVEASEDIDDILSRLKEQFYDQEVIMTVGEKGSYHLYQGECFHVDAYDTDVVDTTAAGDTFIGYYLAMRERFSIVEAMRIASLASSMTCQKRGAAQSIPECDEVLSSYYLLKTKNLVSLTDHDVTWKQGPFKKIPVFYDNTKEWTYQFYKHHLLDEDYKLHYEMIKDKEIESLSVNEALTMITYYIREERTHTGVMAHALQEGVLHQLDQLIRG
jgi:ribokinase